MSVNDYDAFASERQRRLQQGESLPHKYVEKPMMEKLIPVPAIGKSALMLGCGTGEESALLEDRGYTELVGVDSSEKSIEIASRTYPKYQFLHGDMNHLDFSYEMFDFVYSSLAIHYSPDPISVYKEIFRVLKPNGRLLFSVGHPLRWASERIELQGVSTKLLGYSEDENNPKFYGSYLAFKEYSETFPTGEILKFWVGPPSMHFKLLKESGFVIENFVESSVVDECKEVNRYYYE